MHLTEKDFKGLRKGQEVTGRLKEALIHSLAIREVNALRPHEETIQEAESKVAKSIIEAGSFTWPILADSRSGAILDGTHRWKLLKDFCFDFIPVQNIDSLKDAGVRIDVWCRVIYGISEEKFQETLRFFKFSIEPFDECSPIGKRPIVVSPNGKRYVIEEEEKFLALKQLATLERALGIQKFPAYEVYVDSTGVSKYEEMPHVVVTYPPKLTRAEVVDATSKGICFPPKSTRYIFPYRVYNIGVPLHKLRRGEKDATELTEELQEEQAKRRLIYLGKGIDIDRHYEERMFKLED